MYLLPCACGKSIPVEVSQAGDRVTCECGAQVEVPPLRQIHQLPVQPEAADAGRPQSDWAVHQGVLTAGLLIALALAALGGWWWISEPPMPKGFDPGAVGERVDYVLDNISPKQAYDQWVTLYSVSSQFDVVRDPRELALIADIEHHRQVRWTLLIAAAVVAVLSLGLFMQLKPRA